MSQTLTAGARLRHLASFGGFGALLGAVHGLVDVDLLRLLGLQLSWADAVVEAGFFAVAGALGGLALGALLTAARPYWAADAGIRSNLLLGGAALCYAAIVALTVGGATGVGLALLGLVVSAVVIGQAKQAGRAAAAVAISGVLGAVFLLGVEWNEAAPTARPSLAALVVGFSLFTLAFFFVAKRLRLGSVAVFGVWTVLSLLWLTLAPIDSYPWRTIEREPTLGAAPPDKGNLLLVVLDTVRADHMDLFGYERPTMPLLAERAKRDFDVVMKSAAASPWTLPSHATMFTGMHPWRHGAHRASVVDPNPPDSAYPLRPDARVLADVMGEAGYRTGEVAANFAILSGFGLNAGFEHADVTPGTLYLYQRLSWPYRMNAFGVEGLGYLLARLTPSGLRRLSGGYSDRVPGARRAAEITARATEWLDDNGGSQFFLFVNYLDAHAPYLPLPEDDERFGERPADEIPMEELKERFMDQLRGEAEVSLAQLAFVEAQYDAEMVGLDRGLEALFQDLEQRGLYDDTLIIVTSDHGEAFAEHERVWGHETALYDEQISVPLLIKMPASHPADGVVADPAMQHVDLLPTIAEVLGVEAPAGLDGSAWGVGRGYALSEVYCYVCRRNPNADDVELFRRDLAAVVIDGRKAILSTRDNPEFYDLAADPGEQHPLADPPAELVEKARRIVGSREIYVSDSADTDPEMVEKLKSLGYIQ